MRVNQEPDGSLVVAHDSSLLSKGLASGAVILLATAGYDGLIGPRGGERLVALLASAGICLLGAVVTLERGAFRIDPARRTITWDRRWGFQRRAGTIPFDAVRGVVVEVPIGDSGVPNRRISFHLADGGVIPTTVGYRPDSDDRIARTAERIRAALGHAEQPSPRESARLLAEHGRVVEAIKVLRAGGLSMTEAKEAVDAMRGGPEGGSAA